MCETKSQQFLLCDPSTPIFRVFSRNSFHLRVPRDIVFVISVEFYREIKGATFTANSSVIKLLQLKVILPSTYLLATIQGL